MKNKDLILINTGHDKSKVRELVESFMGENGKVKILENQKEKPVFLFRNVQYTTELNAFYNSLRYAGALVNFINYIPLKENDDFDDYEEI